jgi:hypothetical protein
MTGRHAVRQVDADPDAAEARPRHRAGGPLPARPTSATPMRYATRLLHRWWSRRWPSSDRYAPPQSPAPRPPEPPPAPPTWATAPTMYLGPPLTLGQRTGYRVRQPGGDRR